MADLFLSDVHLRLDRPERGQRLARVVSTLSRTDRLVIAGDLCDFWFASRQARRPIDGCEGLKSLAEFRRSGGELILLPGNHDHLLEPFYRRLLGVGFAGPKLDLTSDGLRIHLVHGHLVGARKAWKGLMEGRAFLHAFAALPHPIANALSEHLDRSNDRHLGETERHHMTIYRKYARSLQPAPDLTIFGHIHTPADEQVGSTRMLVLGGWHRRASYLRIDQGSVDFAVEPLAESAVPTSSS